MYLLKQTQMDHHFVCYWVDLKIWDALLFENIQQFKFLVYTGPFKILNYISNVWAGRKEETDPRKGGI